MGLNNLKKKDFCLMNPSVGKDCKGLVEGTYYCISTYPGGNQPYTEDDDDDDEDGDDDEKHTTTTGLAVTNSVPQSTQIPLQHPLQHPLTYIRQLQHKAAWSTDAAGFTR